MNVYFLLYISTYDFFRWIRKDDDPEFRAVIGFSLFVGINIMLISFLAGVPETISKVINGKVFYQIFILSVIVINYFIFVFNRRFKKLYDEFLIKEERKRKNLRWLSFLLMMEGLIAPIIFALTRGFGFLFD